MKTLSITAIRHGGRVENWIDFEEADLIQLAQEYEHQWLLSQGYEPDAIGIDEALEALLHDYASFKIVQVTE